MQAITKTISILESQCLYMAKKCTWVLWNSKSINFISLYRLFLGLDIQYFVYRWLPFRGFQKIGCFISWDIKLPINFMDQFQVHRRTLQWWMNRPGSETEPNCIFLAFKILSLKGSSSSWVGHTTNVSSSTNFKSLLMVYKNYLKHG